MTDEAFLQDVCAHPDDDAPRLIYADWLDDRGDSARADFIRTQCELARLSPGDARAAALARRQDELLDRYWYDWRDALPHLHGITWGDFERGFVGSITA